MNSEPAWQEQLRRMQVQLDDLAARLERLEAHRGLARETSAPPEPEPAPPSPSRAPFEYQSETSTSTTSISTSPLPAVPGPPPPPAPPAATPSTPTPAWAPLPSPSPEPPGTSTTSRARRSLGDWETLIGGQWALWIGSLAVFLSVAFFLAYAAAALPPPPPIVRVWLGAAAGAAFLATGAWARRRAQAWFGEGLSGAGVAIWYVSIWAAAQYFEPPLLRFAPAFALMALVTACGATLALRYNARSLIALATLGGFLTPILLQDSGGTTGGSGTAGGSGAVVPFLLYVALLNAGILGVSLRRRWRGVVGLAFVATLLLLSGWLLDVYRPEYRAVTLFFVTLYFGLFLGSACFYSLLRREETAAPDLLLLFANTFFYAVAGYGLLSDPPTRFPAAFPLALCAFFTALSTLAGTRAPVNRQLRTSAGGLAVFFLVIAVPIQLDQVWIAIAWSVLAAALLTSGLWKRDALLRQAGQIVWLLSLYALPFRLGAEMETRVLFLNERALPLLVSLLATSWMAWQAERSRRATQNSEAAGHEWAAAYVLYAAFLGAWLLGQEFYRACEWSRWPASATWEATAFFGAAMLCSAYALALFVLARKWQHHILGGSALAVQSFAALLPLRACAELPVNAWQPVFNARFAAFVVVAISFALVARLARRTAQASDGAGFMKFVTLFAALAAAGVLLTGLTVETHETARYFAGADRNWRLTAQMAISLVWTLCGAGLLWGGIWRAFQPLRLAGLALLGLTVCKVFLFDLSFLSGPLRVLSFGGLGAALIVISWLYGRFGAAQREE